MSACRARPRPVRAANGRPHSEATRSPSSAPPRPTGGRSADPSPRPCRPRGRGSRAAHAASAHRARRARSRPRPPAGRVSGIRALRATLERRAGLCPASPTQITRMRSRPAQDTVSTPLVGRCRPVWGRFERAAHDYRTQDLNPRRIRRPGRPDRSRHLRCAGVRIGGAGKLAGERLHRRIRLARSTVRSPAPDPRRVRRPAHGLRGFCLRRDRARTRRQLLVPPGSRHLGAGSFARLRRGVGHDHARSRRSGDGRVRKRALVPVLARRPRRARRPAGGGREDAARVRPAQARARPLDPTRG